MTMTDQHQQDDAMDIAVNDLLRMVTEKEAANISWSAFVARLRKDVQDAEHRLAVALKVQDVCSATRPRKVRADKGKSRKAQNPPK